MASWDELEWEPCEGQLDVLDVLAELEEQQPSVRAALTAVRD